VIAGMRDLTAQQFGYDKVATSGVTMAFSTASAVDPQGKSVSLADGNRLAMTAGAGAWHRHPLGRPARLR